MLVEALILQACAGLSGQQLEVCHKVLEASSKQVNVYQDLTNAEQVTTKIVYDKVSNVTGTFVVGAAGVAYKVVRDKRLAYPLKRQSDGLLPAISPSVGTNDGKIELKWSF